MFSSVTYKVSGSLSVYSVAMFSKTLTNLFLFATQILVIKKCQ